MASNIETNPLESANWRKHKNGCPFYRERWFPDNDVMAGEPIYQVYCMNGTPPMTAEEQDRCLHSKTCCWRLLQPQRAAPKQRRSQQDSSYNAV